MRSTATEYRIPIRIKLTGHPTQADLTNLETTIAGAVARRLVPHPTTPAGGPHGDAQAGLVRAEASGLLAGHEAEIPSYEGPPGRVRVPVKARSAVHESPGSPAAGLPGRSFEQALRAHLGLAAGEEVPWSFALKAVVDEAAKSKIGLAWGLTDVRRPLSPRDEGVAAYQEAIELEAYYTRALELARAREFADPTLRSRFVAWATATVEEEMRQSLATSEDILRWVISHETGAEDRISVGIAVTPIDLLDHPRRSAMPAWAVDLIELRPPRERTLLIEDDILWIDWERSEIRDRPRLSSRDIWLAVAAWVAEETVMTVLLGGAFRAASLVVGTALRLRHVSRGAAAVRGALAAARTRALSTAERALARLARGQGPSRAAAVKEPLLPPRPAVVPAKSPPTSTELPLSLRELRSRWQVDEAAGQRLSWYERRTTEQLRRLEADGDAVARALLNERFGGVHRPYAPQRPADPRVQDVLRRDLRRFRSEIERPRRKPDHRFPSDDDLPADPARKQFFGYEGTIGIARSDIPALRGKTFRGASPKAEGGIVDPHSPVKLQPHIKVRQAQGHAEEVLAQRLDASLSRLTPEQLSQARGRSVWIRVDQEVCPICAAGISGAERPGVLKQLSARHPEILFEITADDTSQVIRLLGGRVVP